jgi:hypothetical protein
MLKLLILTLSLLAGCASTPGYERQADGTYKIKKTASSPSTTDAALQADAMRSADDLAKKEGKAVVVVRNETVQQPEKTVNLVFRLKDPYAEEVMKSCLENMERDKGLKIIAKKVALGGTSDQPPAMLNNTKFPNDAEKKAIAHFINLRRDCIHKADQHFESSGYPKSIIALNDLTAGAIDALLLSLQKGDLNYGRFAKLRKKVTDVRASTLNNIEQVLKTNNKDAELKADALVESARNDLATWVPAH